MLVGILDTLQKIVTRAYAKHYAAFRKTDPKNAETNAWNATLDELASPKDFPSKDKRFERRRMIASGLHVTSRKVALRAGDPYRVAVRDAMRELKSENRLVKALKESWQDVVREARRAKERIEDVEVELYAYVMFDRSGRLQGWTIEHAQYFRGHAGPTAAIPAGNVTWKDVESEIAETLAEELR